jgi:hypothetical protein
MSSGLILFVGGIYAIVAMDQLAKGHSAMALVWLGYSVANIGLAAIAK